MVRKRLVGLLGHDENTIKHGLAQVPIHDETGKVGAGLDLFGGAHLSRFAFGGGTNVVT
jgi:hypothetical protein